MMLRINLNFARNISQFSRVLCQQARTSKKTEKKSVGEPREVYNEQYNIKFKRLQLEDKSLSTLMLMVKSKRKLEKEQQIIVEGKQLIKEAVQSHFKLNYLIFSHIEKVADVVNVMGSSTGNVEFIKVPQTDLTTWSVLTTCPGVIGIFTKPPSPKPKENALPITVIGDNIREPNNVGAIIRIANSLPASKVLLPKGCADPWEVKAIRGSSGSIFHMPTETSLQWEQIHERIEEDGDKDNTLVLVADNNGGQRNSPYLVNYDKISLETLAGKNIYLIIGGETHGISDDAWNFALKRDFKIVNIPLDPTVESLNTSNALAVILFELRRKLTSC